eukprot:NODE_454_length_824_cov_292.203730_g445_i0.p1 GENE.NODE_454_length_824_cov_292.203730_g445_i0~~NODE_454_length_824_cov_292.203730_g445_i0.p1  ORF type:complete len:171 (+),score=19.62 NODE_454_length_824_cov_292.203730_g445_i0:104-616(+)
MLRLSRLSQWNRVTGPIRKCTTAKPGSVTNVALLQTKARNAAAVKELLEARKEYFPWEEEKIATRVKQREETLTQLAEYNTWLDTPIHKTTWVKENVGSVLPLQPGDINSTNPLYPVITFFSQWAFYLFWALGWFLGFDYVVWCWVYGGKTQSGEMESWSMFAAEWVYIG